MLQATAQCFKKPAKPVDLELASQAKQTGWLVGYVIGNDDDEDEDADDNDNIDNN